MSNYLNKEEMLVELEKSQKEDRVTEKLGKMFMDIARNLTNHRHFIRYDKETKNDLIGEGVHNCCKGFKKFDVNRGTSPLAYYTQTCYNAYRYYLKNEYEFTNFKTTLVNENSDRVDLNLDDRIWEE